jgi:hypothetical protein
MDHTQAELAKTLGTPEQTLSHLRRRHVDLCPLSSQERPSKRISVNTLFWKIRVTRVEQKFFHREFSLSVKDFEPSRGIS